MMPARLPIRLPFFLCCAALLAAAPFCRAEKADRDKPVNLESDRVTVDEINKVHVFEGNVSLTQGTMVLRGDKLVVKQDAEGFQHGVATANPGNLARFRVKRDGREEYTEGEAERIEYDAKTETAQFFNRAWIKSGQDEVRGQHIVYNSLQENYSVTSGGAPGQDNRVRAVIQPKNKTPAGAVPGQPAQPQTAPGLSAPEKK
jgi:lipopolysaccharide export system protein LptA